MICYKMEYKFEGHVDVVSRLGKDTNYFLNSDKQKSIKWKPFVDLNKGIEKYIYGCLIILNC